MTTPKSLHDQNIKGAQYLLAKDYQKAANMFDGVLKIDPDNMEANAGVAALLYETGNARPGYGYAQKALKNGSNNVPLLHLVVQIALRLGKFDEAKQYAKRAYKLAPKSADGIKAYLLYLQ
ncbi:MAG: tetratricopeptide repeat protein, partial [Helicobacter sp.]|nr:tetratricopeptide repeat protein [Helicobacter sp.]